MELLSRNASLKLIFSFNYLGTDYTITIPGGTDAFDKSIPWYGPQWLLDHFGPNAKALHTYKVVSGDTLSKIARRLHTTVSDLRRKNPQITDPNLIRIGQLIKY
ncbi:MAG: LysM peptidoglycan-binding domain-containing protein [Lachnospiraceae bacterium]|nr:LysM peptidoglycan-binding domain-containing protein [Lachnospiraceae bacterium]